jgi:proteic killer suppression protein
LIRSFADQTTHDIYNGIASKAALKISRNLWPKIQLKLDWLNAAETLEDLKSPPANRLEKLKGDLAGYYSIRVNDQYRLVFRFDSGDCFQMLCTDYH